MTGHYPTLDFDPAPGDVDVVENLRSTASQVADRLSSAAGGLRQLGHSGGAWHGQAAQAFARRVGELPQHLADGENSMSAACRALSTWSAELVDFQRRAAAYERQAADALDFVVSLPGKAWDWVKDHADLIAQIGDILSDISTVLGVVATVCMFIPPLEAVSGVLFAVSAGFALGALGMHGLAKTAGADVSWGTIALDSVGVLTWGVGKVATKCMKNARARYNEGLEHHKATGFLTNSEVIGAANFLHYARVWKRSVVTGTTGLELSSWNPWFGNVADDVKKGWNAVSGQGKPGALGATFVNGVGGAQARHGGQLAPA